MIEAFRLTFKNEGIYIMYWSPLHKGELQSWRITVYNNFIFSS